VKRWLGFVAIATGGLVLSACGGGGGEGAGSDGSVVLASSPDGVVTVSAAPDSGAAGIELAVDVVGEPSPTTTELAAAGFQVFEYDLSPSGQQFEEPVTVTFTLDRSTLGIEEGEWPEVVLVSGSPGGDVYELYDAIDLTVNEDAVIVSGETSHFSTITLVIGGVLVKLAPAGVSVAVGDSFEVSVTGSPDKDEYEKGLHYEFSAAAPWLRVLPPGSGDIGGSTGFEPEVGMARIECLEETPFPTLAKYWVEIAGSRTTRVNNPLARAYGITTQTGRVSGGTYGLAQCTPQLDSSVSEPPTTSTTSTTSTMGDTAPPSTSDDDDSSDGQSTEVGSAAGSTECPDREADVDQVGDGRAHPEFVRAFIDEITRELYFQMFMCAAYGELPPDELFSFFWLMLVSWNPTAEVGWELHDGTVTVLGAMSEAYILEDGSLLVATGLTPTGDYTITIDASYGSWVAEDGAPPVFGDTQFSIPAADVVLGDPFEEAVAEPVYDLVAGE
jgi:hypothetical protein